MFERLTGNALHDIARDCGRVVRIGRNLTGRKDALWNVILDVILQAAHVLCVLDEQVLTSFFKARGVRHNVPQGDGLSERGWNLEIQVIVHVPVQIELALLDQLHHRGPGKELRN